MHGVTADLIRALDPHAISRETGFVPDPWQAELIESTCDRILINASRQSGKSTTVSQLATNQALLDPGLIIIGAPSQRQSIELFRKIVETLRTANGVPKFEVQSTTKLEMENGTRIIALPGTEATVRGYSSPRMILLDEAARIDDEFYKAIRPMLAAGNGRLIALTSPWGRRGWFYEAFEHGGDHWQRFRVPATECPRISPEFLAEELRELGPLRFASEYLCNFVDVEDQYFPTSLIEQALSDDVRPLWAA